MHINEFSMHFFVNLMIIDESGLLQLSVLRYPRCLEASDPMRTTFVCFI